MDSGLKIGTRNLAKLQVGVPIAKSVGLNERQLLMTYL